MGSQGQKNIDASNVINKAIQTGDVNTLDKVIAADAVDHAGMTGDIKGLDSIKAVLEKIHDWADMKMEVIKELADDEYVFQWIRFKGRKLHSFKAGSHAFFYSLHHTPGGCLKMNSIILFL